VTFLQQEHFRRLGRALAGHAAEILFVDDSDDETARTASGVSRRRAPGRTPWGPADGAGAGTVDISDGGAVIEHRLQSADD
jgi:hypothetical protein